MKPLEDSLSFAPTNFVTPSAFLAQHKLGDRGWIFIQSTLIECELVGYLIEVSGKNNKSSEPAYKVKFYMMDDEGLSERETVVKESDFKNTIDEVLDEIRKDAIIYPGDLSEAAI